MDVVHWSVPKACHRGCCGKDLRYETISYAVAEGYECDGHERRNCIADVAPVDSRHLAYHQAANLETHQQNHSNAGKQPTEKLTKISVHPVAQGGILANIGAKKMDTKKHNPVTIAVKPVRPPSAIPAPLSMKAVTGEQPSKDPMLIHAASIQYATVERGKSPSLLSFRFFARSFCCCARPQNRAMEYSVAVQSMMSTYRNVNNARAKEEPCDPERSHCCALSVWVIGWNDTTLRKKAKRASPSAVAGK